jgi:predicted RNase H-like nuclease (RuvC/YqgF family)
MSVKSSAKAPKPNEIAWHQRNLESEKATIETYYRQRKDMDARIDRLNEQIILLTKQLIRARAEGKQSFDAERYCKSKK